MHWKEPYAFNMFECKTDPRNHLLMEREINIADWIARWKKLDIEIVNYFQTGPKILQATKGKWSIQTNCSLCELLEKASTLTNVIKNKAKNLRLKETIDILNW